MVGGEGKRLRPFTYYTSKHLLPVFNRPMIFYPLMNLLLLGVENICIVVNKKHILQWENLFQGLNLPINIIFSLNIIIFSLNIIINSDIINLVFFRNIIKMS